MRNPPANTDIWLEYLTLAGKYKVISEVGQGFMITNLGAKFVY